MFVSRLTRVAVILVTAVSLIGTGDYAAAASQALNVTANVPKQASLGVLAQPAAVVITAADITRGYVDAPDSVHLSIRNNSAEGYVLDFASAGDFIRRIQITGLGNEVQMGPAGGLVPQSRATSRPVNTTVSLTFRFILSDVARPGIYPWPMRLSASPM